MQRRIFQLVFIKNNWFIKNNNTFFGPYESRKSALEDTKYIKKKQHLNSTLKI